jgi:hypothetical protein
MEFFPAEHISDVYLASLHEVLEEKILESILIWRHSTMNKVLAYRHMIFHLLSSRDFSLPLEVFAITDLGNKKHAFRDSIA